MAHISENEIQRLRVEVSLVRLVEAEGGLASAMRWSYCNRIVHPTMRGHRAAPRYRVRPWSSSRPCKPPTMSSCWARWRRITPVR